MEKAFLVAPSGHVKPKRLKNAIINLKKLNFKAKYINSINAKFFL